MMLLKSICIGQMKCIALLTQQLIYHVQHTTFLCFLQRIILLHPYSRQNDAPCEIPQIVRLILCHIQMLQYAFHSKILLTPQSNWLFGSQPGC